MDRGMEQNVKDVRRELAAVGVLPKRDSVHLDSPLLIVYTIESSVASDAEAVSVAPAQLLASRRTGIIGEPVDGGLHPTVRGIRKPS